jgi:glutamate-1-semialdehyde 2,1-aminomutase
MTAGCVVLGEIFTSDVAVAHTSRGDEFRKALQAVAAKSGAPVCVTGFGSMMSIHAIATAPQNADDMAKRDAQLQELLFFGLLERGVYIAARGMVNLGLPHTDDQLAQFLDAFAETLASLT